MSADRWKRIDDLFGNARQLAPDARNAFLERCCGGDTELLSHVRRLLRDHDRAGPRFLERPRLVDRLRGLSRADGPDPLIGQAIGSYTIKEPIARGGMGTVYLAEQSNPRRHVALKIMHSGAWSASAERRFDFESHVLGYLRHPNIAQIIEAGTHRLEAGATFHYFAMEYVADSRTITRYAVAQSLSLRDRLDLFLQLCDAVHYGHQKGIIHRDLKPANILVDPEGRVKVIDFGIARATDSDIAITTMHTETGQFLGTLSYMSPEQCAADPGQIDITTDIYSLGVILYELLTWRMPYDVSNMTIHAATRVICEQEPTPPSLLDRRLRGDIETIILKAIEKDRKKRYESPSDLANDIRRHLRGEPIEAKPPTAWTQALRWAIRRPKTVSALACLLIAGMVIGATTVTVYWINLRPHHLELSQDRSEARLATWQGRPLHTWNTGAIAGMSFAELVERPIEFGGGRLAIIGFSGLSKIHQGRVCAFGLQEDWAIPGWETKVEEGDMPEDVRSNPAQGGFHAAHVLIADFFPSQANPGNEVAVVFAHSWSRRLVRICDLTGKPLYGFWQDGGIDSLCWMRNDRLLICCGASEVHKSVAQHATGFASTSPMIFAVRPRVLGALSREYILGRQSNSAGSLSSSDSTGTIAWCKYLHPPGLPGLSLSLSQDQDSGAITTGDHLAVSIRAKRGETDVGRLHAVMDRNGRLVAGPRAGDSWNANKNELNLPDAEIFTLSDDPPPLAPLSRTPRP